MKKLVIIIIVVFIATIQCEKNSVNSKENGIEKYVIYPANDGNNVGFVVKDINSKEKEFVGGVTQINGNIYLPIMSSVPSFNNQVVKGYFVEDTNYYYDLTGDIFKVTKHLRDTSLGFYGE